MTTPPGTRLLAAAALALALVVAPATAATAADPGADRGWVHTGVGSEDEARDYPCPQNDLGGWERTGPVVCLEKRAAAWTLTYDPPGNGCTYQHTTGWSGSCLFDVDMGDHVRVWGTRGIPYTEFRLTWHDAAAAPASGDDPGDDPGTSGTDGESGTYSPEGPDSHQAWAPGTEPSFQPASSTRTPPSPRVSGAQWTRREAADAPRPGDRQTAEPSEEAGAAASQGADPAPAGSMPDAKTAAPPLGGEGDAAGTGASGGSVIAAAAAAGAALLAAGAGLVVLRRRT